MKKVLIGRITCQYGSHLTKECRAFKVRISGRM